MTSDNDASSAIPGARDVDAGPGDEDQLPQVEANAVALWKLFQA